MASRERLPALCEQLEDLSARIRLKAADALGRIGDGRAVEPLCRRLALARVLDDTNARIYAESGVLIDVQADLDDLRAAEPMSACLRGSLRGRPKGVPLRDSLCGHGHPAVVVQFRALERFGGLDLVFDAYERVLRIPDEILYLDR